MVKAQYELAMPGRITPILVHQTPTVEVKVVVHQQFLSMARPWQESGIQSVAVMLAPPAVPM
jgi:hypothetical protein